MSALGSVATLPLAPGTPPKCHSYYNHHSLPNRPAAIESPQQNLWAPPPKPCKTIASIINVDVEELIRLNPSLHIDNCVIEPGLSYCAEETRQTKTCEHFCESSLKRRFIRLATSRSSSSTGAEPPICSFDPEKGEYTCPDPPICRFDPAKGEYVCPDSELEAGGEREELR